MGKDAVARWEKDLELLDHFYADHDESLRRMKLKKDALKDQYEPKGK